MGFCTDDQYSQFIAQVPAFEKMLVDDGIYLVKFWFSINMRRAAHAVRDPADRSGPAVEAVADGSGPLDKWDSYGAAKEAMFAATDNDFRAVDRRQEQRQKRARLNAMRHVLVFA